jgi:hypothetical protein
LNNPLCAGKALPNTPGGAFSILLTPFLLVQQERRAMNLSMISKPTLPAIITAARAGALDYARTLFHRGGYDQRRDDPAAMAVQGRLLKDLALRLPKAQQADGYRDAAAAYARADALFPQPYTRINVATLTLLAGDRAGARKLAGAIIDWLDGASQFPETPYFLAATRAEALLLCGDAAAARDALEQAIVHCPDGWDDHASTLRQLQLILTANQMDAGWLDAFRPPRSLYFAGHLGVAAEGSEDLRAKIDAILAEENIGFGFGALAAGADIVIAEQVLARGADLHVVLPTLAEDFIAQSVAPYGGDWRQRFDACLDAATTIKSTAHVTGDYEPLATRLASDVAMGAAVLNARGLESEAVQLIVLDEGDGPLGDGLGTARDGERWLASGRRQHNIRWPRSGGVMASGLKTHTEGRRDRRLAAMLHISFAGIDDLDEAQFADAIDTVLAPLRRASMALAVQPELTLPSGNARLVAFAMPEAAFAHAQALLALYSGKLASAGELPSSGKLALRIAGHYALAHWLDTPPALVGRGVAELGVLASAAMPGVLTLSEAFASALFAGSDADIRAEWIGEIGDMRLFSVAGAGLLPV